jgi:hypothetical protein
LHATSAPAARNPLTDLLDHPSGLDARNEGSRRPVVGPALTLLGVDEVHTPYLVGDQQLI